MAKQINILLLLALVLLTGCKKDDWLDWKARNQMALEQIKQQPGFQTSSTGLVYRILQDDFRSEAVPNDASYISCYPCEGYLINGWQFQSAPLGDIQVSQLIAGFQEGIKKIHAHGSIELYIPYDLGYGDQAQGTEGTVSFIPPYSTLHFIITLSSVY